MHFREQFTVAMKADALSVHRIGKWKGRGQMKGKTGNNTKEELEFHFPVQFTCQKFCFVFLKKDIRT